MKFFITAVIFSLATATSIAQTEVNIYTEREGNQVFIYADNPAVVPMTVDLKLDLTNMKTDFGGKNGIFVIPPKASRFKIVTANSIRKSGRTGIGLESFIYIGDVRNEHDRNFVYELPFGPKETFIVSQGYNGRFSHRGENALDFDMETGDKVFAARGGIVYKVIEKNSKSCHHSSCQEFNNHITVYHSDGTFSEYSHLKYNGAVVKEGDKIETGDFIGYSGNTGWSSGPHLHFVVYKYNEKGKRETLKTKFRTLEKDGVYLVESRSYTKK